MISGEPKRWRPCSREDQVVEQSAQGAVSQANAQKAN